MYLILKLFVQRSASFVTVFRQITHTHARTHTHTHSHTHIICIKSNESLWVVFSKIMICNMQFGKKCNIFRRRERKVCKCRPKALYNPVDNLQKMEVVVNQFCYNRLSCLLGHKQFKNLIMQKVWLSFIFHKIFM